MKATLPTQRDKKRFLAVVCKKHNTAKTADQAIHAQLKGCIGTFGLARAGYEFLAERFRNKTAVIKIDIKNLDDAKMALLLKHEDFIVIGVSGTLKGLESQIERYAKQHA